MDFRGDLSRWTMSQRVVRPEYILTERGSGRYKEYKWDVRVDDKSLSGAYRLLNNIVTIDFHTNN